ncbi:MAG: HAD-IIA family hydrolase [Armatimonadetes bacterium]|nr:HAD-IIA family hydrolase [Armatimonadota bacterium]
MTDAASHGSASASPAEQPRLFIFDLDGVIYRGDTVLPYAAATIRTLQQTGATVFYLTNNSTRTRESYAQKLAGMGIPAPIEQIMTSSYAAALYFSEEGLSGTRAYVVGEEGIVDELSRVGVRVVQGVDEQRVESVVVGLDREFSYRKLCAAQQAILNGARFIATNTDKTFPVEGGKLIPGGGALVAAVQACTGIEPTVIGKPEVYALRKITEITGIPPQQTVIVGDRLDTDILAGRRMNYQTVLVLTGVCTQEAVEQAAAEYLPDHVLPDLSGLTGIA